MCWTKVSMAETLRIFQYFVIGKATCFNEEFTEKEETPKNVNPLASRFYQEELCRPLLHLSVAPACCSQCHPRSPLCYSKAQECWWSARGSDSITLSYSERTAMDVSKQHWFVKALLELFDSRLYLIEESLFPKQVILVNHPVLSL